MQAWESAIIRVSTGRLNTVNDTVIAGQAGIGSLSKFAGQLGKYLTVSREQIAGMYDSDVGTLYGGIYQYVRRRAADDDSPAMAAGKIAFWDTTVTSPAWQEAFQVTADVNLSSSANAIMRAGIFLGNIEPGNYGFIQILGLVNIRFRSVLTAAGAIGSPVYAADVGDTGADQGTADVLTTDSTAVANERALGYAVAAPTGGSLTLVALRQDGFVRIG